MQDNRKQNMVLTTPDDITRHDKNTIKARITPAVATNRGDPRVHQATKNITRHNEDKPTKRLGEHQQ